jgi:Holliday junction resolvase RusA-like endonuclease
MRHLEFVVLGPPVSNQPSDPANLAAWKTTVKGEAQKRWKKPPLTGRLKAIIINFHIGDKPSVDVDNMSKPILDVM